MAKGKARNGQYKMVESPHVRHQNVICNSSQQLRTFIEHGGHVLFSFKSAVADENIKIRTVRQPGLLTDLLGVSYQLVAEPHNVKLISSKLDLSTADCQARDFMELVTVDNPKVEVLASYDHRYYQKYAAVSYLKQEQGGSGTYIGADVSQDVIGQVLEYIIADNQLLPERTKLRFPLIERTALDGANRKIRFIMNFSEQEQTITYQGKNAQSLLDGCTVATGTPLTLKDWGCLVLKEQ